MRKILASTLFFYLFTLGLPVVIAQETICTSEGETGCIKACSFVTMFSYDPYSGDASDTAAKEAYEEERDQAYEDWLNGENGYNTKLESSYLSWNDKDGDGEKDDDEVTPSGNCGESNSFTGYLEKGDCTAEGSVITEISEVIAPDVELEDAENRVMTVYAGLCCLAAEESASGVQTCDDTRTIYTGVNETWSSNSSAFDACEDAVGEGDCERKQWVIASSGVNLVQVVVKQIFTWGAFTVGGIAVMTMVIQGVKISVSGVSGDITESKNKILQAIAGIVLLFLSGLILYTINPSFFT